MYELLLDRDNLYEAFILCKRNVSWKKSVQLYRYDLLTNINNTIKMLENDISKLKLSRNTFYLNERGKTRKITNIKIEERVIQKVLCHKILLPLIRNKLIYDNYASLKGRGLKFARKRISVFLNKYYKINKTNKGYVLTIDFRKYFDSIDHKILLKKLSKIIKDERVIELIKFLIYNKEQKGLNLGSELSQICALFYLNELDHFIKEKLKIKYYGRYMDDLVLIHPDKEYLKYCLKEIEKICEKLDVQINKKKTFINKLSNFVFIKVRYSLKEDGFILKQMLRKSYTRLKNRIKKYTKLLKENKITYKEYYFNLVSIKSYCSLYNAFYKHKRIVKYYISVIKGDSNNEIFNY